MKYIKHFNESSENNYYDNILSDIKDISLSEFEGSEFETNIYFENLNNVMTLITKVYKKNGDFFRFNDTISDYLLRVYQYMRELGWYSKLEYKSGSMTSKKKFYIRPDDRMRNQDLLYMDETYPYVSSIELNFYK